MTFLRRLFYLPFINFLYRNLLYPIKGMLPDKFKIPVIGIISISYQDKKINFFSDETCPMARHLYWEDKGCTFEFSNIFIDLVKNSKVFFDVGANVGYYSLLSKTVNPSIDTFAFEPSNGPNHFLNTNIKLNNFETIIVVNKALGNSVGSIDFYEEKNPKYPYRKYHASGIGNTINNWGITNFSKYSVDLTTLDNFTSNSNIEVLDLIKMDTEGTEDLVLEGAISTIKKFLPIIICEVLPNKVEKRIEKIILDLNYDMFQFVEHSKKLIKIKALYENPNDINSNYFFVPKTKSHLIEKFLV
jgi:FkbM family methyltransferase